jgi:thiol-disulfide isomerase/thioredoxin
MMKHILLPLVTLLLLSLPGRAAAELKAGQRAVDFDKPNLHGAPVKLSALRGKVVLLDFWASWCEPCKKELPLLGKLAARLRDRGVEIVTINIDDNRAKADAFVRSHALDALTVVHDADKAIVGKYEPNTMPSSFVVDRTGVVRIVNAGFEDGDEAKIEKQLLALAGK